MITRHFIKMFLGLIFMACIGLFGLIYTGILAAPAVGDQFASGIGIIENFIVGKPTAKIQETLPPTVQPTPAVVPVKHIKRSEGKSVR
jgi:hypothetical protein